MTGWNGDRNVLQLLGCLEGRGKLTVIPPGEGVGGKGPLPGNLLAFIAISLHIQSSAVSQLIPSSCKVFGPS